MSLLGQKSSHRNFLSLILPLFLLATTPGADCRAGSFTNLLVLWPFPTTSGATAYPLAPLIEASDGALYGTTYGYQLTSDNGGVFKMNKDGSSFSFLHMLAQDGSEGFAPTGALIEATNGVLYGTAFYGGLSGLGSIFKINKNGAGFAVIHDFTGAIDDGANPAGALIQGADGALYGTTTGGGTAYLGVVFKMNLDGGGFAVLHSFLGGTNDGTSPQSSLAFGTNGALYGTTFGGGPSDAGTVFQINPNGSNFAVVHVFGSIPNDGSSPYASLFNGPNNKLYGTTDSGGAFGSGAVFSLDQTGSNYTVLHSFTNASNDGQSPFYSSLALGPDGALYGTTSAGGNANRGTVFKIAPDGSGYAVLIRFGGTNGSIPDSGLLAASNGALYGTCSSGGSLSRGTVFILTSGLFDDNLLANPLKLSGTAWRISGRGAPGRVYTLQFATNLAPPTAWSTLTTVSADSQGNWQFDDLTNAPPRYYRTSFP
jgi:uncharacterized repeat protein (TIGR03803 family)